MPPTSPRTHDTGACPFLTEHPKVPPTGFRTLIFTGIFWRCFVASSPQFVRNRIWCQKPRVPPTSPRTHDTGACPFLTEHDTGACPFLTEHPKVPPTGFRTLIFTGIFWCCFVASSPQFVRNRIWCQRPRVPATYPRTHQKVPRTDSPRNYSGVPVLSDVPSDV